MKESHGKSWQALLQKYKIRNFKRCGVKKGTAIPSSFVMSPDQYNKSYDSYEFLVAEYHIKYGFLVRKYIAHYELDITPTIAVVLTCANPLCD